MLFNHVAEAHLHDQRSFLPSSCVAKRAAINRKVSFAVLDAIFPVSQSPAIPRLFLRVRVEPHVSPGKRRPVGMASHELDVSDPSSDFRDEDGKSGNAD